MKRGSEREKFRSPAKWCVNWVPYSSGAVGSSDTAGLGAGPGWAGPRGRQKTHAPLSLQWLSRRPGGGGVTRALPGALALPPGLRRLQAGYFARALVGSAPGDRGWRIALGE